jgi:hypothetical protein
MRRVKFSMPSPAMVVACLALTVALGGTAWAALGKNSVDSKQIAPQAVGGSELANGAVGGKKLKAGVITEDKLADGAVSTAKIADSGVTGPKIAPLSVDLSKLGISVVTHYTDTPLPDDGTRTAGVATCPAGQAIVGGGVSFTFPSSVTPVPTDGSDIRILSSRPGIAPNGDFPADGSTFDAWRATAINTNGGATGPGTSLTVQAICLK